MWGGFYYFIFDGIFYIFWGNCIYVFMREIYVCFGNFSFYLDNYYCMVFVIVVVVCCFCVFSIYYKFMDIVFIVIMVYGKEEGLILFD